MNRISRRGFIGLTAAGIGGLAVGSAWPQAETSQASAAAFEQLYRQFKDPARSCSIRPFWFWNGKLDGDELRRQIKQMVDHGVYGAYVHNRDGLQTPYLSEEWWEAVGHALAAAREYGFSLCMVDEFEWPSGEARDYWLPGINKSRVVAANPDFQVKRLRPRETRVRGPRTVKVPLPERTAVAGVGRWIAEGTLDGDSLKTVPIAPDAKELSWEAPEGDWIIFTYSLERTAAQPDHGTVDLMSREAVAEYIRIYYEEFYRRYGEHFGNTLPATFADHEGSYGAKLPWTPRLFDAFEKRTGYSLQAFLPALTYDIGPKTEKVRCDLLDTCSELYCDSFFSQVSDWCKAHKIDHSAHVWEETLLFGPAYQGDFFRILRSLTNPGCDTLDEWGRQSVWLKENASVADFEKRHVVCENQGVQGESSYLSPERMRRVSNCLGAWNIGEFIPHAFDYDLTRTNYPPDWFRSQPFLAWFRSYADQMRRISFMNRESSLVADILLYYPQVSVWGQSAPAFSDHIRERMMDERIWSSDANETNDQYAQIKLRLSDARLDYKVADDFYLGESTLQGNRLLIADSSFQTLVLAPMSTIRRATAERILSFYRAGGVVIALRSLPTISTESGRDDPALKRIWDELFDDRPSVDPFRLRTNAAGGRAYFVPRSAADLLVALREYIDPDVLVTEGSAEHLFVLHKIKAQTHFYWVVNDTPQSRTNLLSFRATGRPERWVADNAERSPLFYQSLKDRTLVRLTLAPWDAAYIAFDSGGPLQPLALKATSLDEFSLINTTEREATVFAKSLLKPGGLSVTLAGADAEYQGQYQPEDLKPLPIDGEWKVSAGTTGISQPYVLVLDDFEDRGFGEAWYAEANDRRPWQPMWLTPMNAAFHDWNLIGPFPNPEDHGLDESYPPEKSIDYEAVYPGDNARLLRWKQAHAADYHLYPEDVRGGIGTMVTEGGPYGNDSFAVRYDDLVDLSPLQGTVYAQTNLYSPVATDAVLVLATSCPRAAFLNGVKVYSRWLRPLYNDLSDGFSVLIPIHLNAGWNNLLLKFLHNAQDPTRAVFACRAQRPDGTIIEGVFSATRSYDPGAKNASTGYRWLRLAVPPLASALPLPPFQHPWLAFVDGKRVPAASPIPVTRGTKTVTLRVAEKELLNTPFTFSTTPTELPLGSWKVPGMENFSGQMTYEKTVEIPAAYLKEHLLLDCGEVGVVAEAWVNGKYAGSRAWAPYVFDITDQIHAGSNQIKVCVANTEANARAVGKWRPILDNIDCDGWHGPAVLVPFMNREIRLERKS